MTVKLEFIVGGVQKAGTTSLFGYLSDHPSFIAPAKKELHFFDDETIDWQRPDYGALKPYFLSDETGRLPFEVTPIYLFWPPSLERIRRHNPAIKLIFIFRDPIERAWSHWSMERRRNAENLPFSAAIRHGRWRLRGIPQLDPVWRVYSYVERGFYGAQVKRLLDIFPRDNVLFLRSTDLLTRHHETLSAIAAFLKQPPFPDLAARLDHQGAEKEERMSGEDVAYLREIFVEDLSEFSALTGLEVGDWLTISGQEQAP